MASICFWSTSTLCKTTTGTCLWLPTGHRSLTDLLGDSLFARDGNAKWPLSSLCDRTGSWLDVSRFLIAIRCAESKGPRSRHWDLRQVVGKAYPQRNECCQSTLLKKISSPSSEGVHPRTLSERQGSSILKIATIQTANPESQIWFSNFILCFRFRFDAISCLKTELIQTEHHPHWCGQYHNCRSKSFSGGQMYPQLRCKRAWIRHQGQGLLLQKMTLL